MMHRLQPEVYPDMRPLFQEAHLSFVVEAMIAGSSPALVWADQPDAPRTVLIWDNAHCLYLAGKADNAAFNDRLRQLLTERILPEGQARRLSIFKLYAGSEGWEPAIGSVFGTIPLTRRERLLLTLTDFAAAPILKPLPDGFRLERITPRHLTEAFENSSKLAAEIDSSWSSTETFFSYGIGCCAVRNDHEIVGWCTTEYSSVGQCGIGVETIEAYASRGIATQVAWAVIYECRSRHIRPHWDSWTSNLASIAVARKLGFDEQLRYNVWLGQF